MSVKGVIDCLFCSLPAAVEGAGWGWGAAPDEDIQPLWDLHHVSVSGGRRRAQEVPRIPIGWPGPDRCSIWRVSTSLPAETKAKLSSSSLPVLIFIFFLWVDVFPYCLQYDTDCSNTDYVFYFIFEVDPSSPACG